MSDTLSTTWAVVIGIIAVWELFWKGLGLWRAGRNNQAGWFVAILLLNTVGLLPIIYLLLERNKRDKAQLKRLQTEK